jgi:hypothetical protein
MFPSIRYLRVIFCLLLGVAFFATRDAYAEKLPEIRPAMVGSGPKSLVNLIDTQHLMKRGLDHNAILFSVRVEPNGQTLYGSAYGATGETEILKDEVQRKLRVCRFIPAVYNHHNTFAWFYGTVVFWTSNGQPHLRVYANQEISEVERGSDFIEPQSINVPGHFYDRVQFPEGSWWSEEKPSTVEMLLSVDVTGKLNDVRVLKSEPPSKKMEEAMVKHLKRLTYLPAFRNGHPVASTTHCTAIFRPEGWSWK